MSKIDVISGFLGAGKTTLISKLLKDVFAGRQVVLVENEFGEIGIDGGFLKEAGIEIREINSGCICCTLKGDFQEALLKVEETYHPDHILIEPSGVGKLSDILTAVKSVEGTELSSYSTVVDAERCGIYHKNFKEFFDNQIATASCVILSRTQAVTEQKLAEDLAIIKELNPNARVITTPWNELNGNTIYDAMTGSSNGFPAMDEPEEEESCCCSNHEHHHDDEEESCCCHGDHEHHHEDDENDPGLCTCGKHAEDEPCTCGRHGDHNDEEHEHHHHHHDDEEESCCCHGDHEHNHEDDENDPGLCTCGKHAEDEPCTCGRHGDHNDEEHEHHHHHHDDEEESCCCHGDHEHHHGHEHHHHHHGHDADEVFDSIGFQTVHAYTAEELKEALGKLGDNIIRAKGIVKANDGGWYFFDYVPGSIDVRNGTPSWTGLITIIGEHVDEAEMKTLFKAN